MSTATLKVAAAQGNRAIGRDIVVIGTSAGGSGALVALIRQRHHFELDLQIVLAQLTNPTRGS